MKKRPALLLCVLSLVCMLVLLSLPLMRFSCALETKRSANTFVGDEKYLGVRAEMEVKQAQ